MFSLCLTALGFWPKYEFCVSRDSIDALFGLGGKHLYHFEANALYVQYTIKFDQNQSAFVEIRLVCFSVYNVDRDSLVYGVLNRGYLYPLKVRPKCEV